MEQDECDDYDRGTNPWLARSTPRPLSLREMGLEIELSRGSAWLADGFPTVLFLRWTIAFSFFAINGWVCLCSIVVYFGVQVYAENLSDIRFGSGAGFEDVSFCSVSFRPSESPLEFAQFLCWCWQIPDRFTCDHTIVKWFYAWWSKPLYSFISLVVPLLYYIFMVIHACFLIWT